MTNILVNNDRRTTWNCKCGSVHEQNPLCKVCMEPRTFWWRRDGKKTHQVEGQIQTKDNERFADHGFEEGKLTWRFCPAKVKLCDKCFEPEQMPWFKEVEDLENETPEKTLVKHENRHPEHKFCKNPKVNLHKLITSMDRRLDEEEDGYKTPERQVRKGRAKTPMAPRKPLKKRRIGELCRQ